MNNTQSSNLFFNPTFIWCLLMPGIHFLSLFSNIICIIVFCSKTFIHKPIAIYFICLLISDSTTLLIGYTEMLDRESSMINKSSFLCLFNGKIMHRLTEFIYTFMGKFCLEWMLYKVLWTRASTILLAILSIQRTRTFFSLSYRETRCCALFACLTSILLASAITCFEWIGIQCDKSTESYVYLDIFQLIMNKQVSKQFYSDYLYNHYNQSIKQYPCIIEALNVDRPNNTVLVSKQFNCSSTELASEFYSITQSLLTDRDGYINDTIHHFLTDIYDQNFSHTNASRLFDHLKLTQTSDVMIKLFEKRPCYITIAYSIYLKFFYFLQSLHVGFNRHTLAIFFGNALPSFLVFLANLLSLKVIYFSKSLKYLKYSTQRNRRRRRLKNDLRAFLVILIEGFSVITISWGIPIFLTMYHCQTLYVVSIASCPQIKSSLAIFLFTDLFNSSTNCLLYSLSGKLFRRKFIFILKTIFTCGRGCAWNAKQHSPYSTTQNLEVQASNDPSMTYNNNASYSRAESYRHSELMASIPMNKLKILSKNKTISNVNGSIGMIKTSDEQNGSYDSVIKPNQTNRSTDKLNKTQRIKTFFMDKVPFFRSTTTNEFRKEMAQLEATIIQKRQLKNTVSFSSSSGAGSHTNNSFRQQWKNPRHSSRLVLISNGDSQLIPTNNLPQNVTCL